MTLPFARPRDIPETGDPRPTSNIYRFILRMGGGHQIGICLVALAVAAIAVAPIELQKRIINDAIEGEDFDLLLWLGGIYLAVILARRALKFVLALYQRWLSESAALHCRRGLADAWAEGADEDEARAARDEGRSGRTVSVVSSEIDKVCEFVGTGLSDPVASGAKLVFAAGYMLLTEPLLALVALGFFVPQAVIAPLVQRWLNKLERRRIDLLRRLSDDLVKPGGVGDERLGSIFGNRMVSESVKQALKAALRILTSLAPLSVLVFGGYLYIQGSTSVGVIVAFMSGFERMADPAGALINYYRIASIRNEQHGKVADWLERALERSGG